MLSKAGHWVCLLWDIIGGTLVEVNVRHYLWLSWATCLKPQNNPLFVADSAGPCYVWEGPSCAPRPASTSTEPRGWSAKLPRHPEICLYLSPLAGFLIILVTEGAFVGTQVAWGRFSVSHQVGVSGVHQIDTGSYAVPVLGLRPLSESPRVQA